MGWSLSNRVAIVTGATSAIGEAIVNQLLYRGVKRVVIAGRKEESLSKLALRLSQNIPAHPDGSIATAGLQRHLIDSSTTDVAMSRDGHPLIVPVAADITNAEDCKRIIKTAVDVGSHGHVDLLVNCAGITKDAIFATSSDADFEELWKTNVLGPLRLTRLALRQGKMLSKKDGAVVFVGSVVARTGNQGQVGYGATKAALEGATVSLSKEYGGSNIRFNVVAPGLVEGTGMHNALDKKTRDAFMEKTALRRLATVAEVAEAVVMTAQAQYVTGSVIRVDGGM
jgi:3-oxoacyl-[acyl-carrier protein] reductase